MLDSRLLEFNFNKLNLIIFFVGVCLNVFAYLSMLPVVAAGLYYCASFFAIKCLRLCGDLELKMFSRMYCIGWMAAGIAAVYVCYFNDEGQLFSDAGGFFDLASGQSSSLSIIEIQQIYGGPLAILIWANVYDFFAMIGFPRSRYIGILLNVALVSLAALITLKMARIVFPDDSYRLNRLILLFPASGLIWLFAGIHVRDAFALFIVSLLGYAWLTFLSYPRLKRNLVLIICANFVASFLLGFVRTDFIFVPIAMALAAIVAWLFCIDNNKNKKIIRVIVVIILALIFVSLYDFVEEVISILSSGKEGYAELVASEHGSDSLGVSLIINQSLPIRLVLASAYLFVFPIPFWVGFQLDSAYSLFKTLNVIFFYFVLPLVLMAVWRIYRIPQVRSLTLTFVVILSIGFTMVVAGTSMETRHLGAFLPYVFLLAILPDLRGKQNFDSYKRILISFLLLILLIHLSWAIIKN